MRQQLLFVTSSKLIARKKHLVLTGILSLLLLAFIVNKSAVWAQSPSADLSTGLATESVMTSTPGSNTTVPTPSYDEQLADLARAYRGQLEEYRTKEREYVIARTDFLQLETLASLENLLTSIREAVIVRDQVLETYLQQLRINLVATPGIEVDAKERALTHLERVIEALQLHRQLAAQAQNRDQIQELTNTFEIIAPELTNAAYFSLSLIEYGQLRSVNDQTKAFYDDLASQNMSDMPQSIQDRWQRNLQEVDDQFSITDQQFQSIFQLILEGEQEVEDDVYREVKTDLNQVYAQINRIQSFLDELI